MPGLARRRYDVMGTVIQDTELQDRGMLFADRAHAGRLLARKLMEHKGADGIVLAIPAGGVPVAAEIARALSWPMDVAVARKIQVPWNTEAGFGAMGPDGEVILNQRLLRRLGLSDDDVREQIEKTKEVIGRRIKLFRGVRAVPSLSGKVVIIVDDGIASGYTMRAAIHSARKQGPATVIAAAPTGSEYSIDDMLHEADETVCLNVRSAFHFAIADAYVNWYDVPDAEVVAILEKYREHNP